jgi:glycosyltransferase involved in cell wall biosynthesis
METKIELSIIVPIFNVENFLEKALTSLIEQSLKSIEIILVDDCSTDRSRDICMTFKKKDNRIVYLALPENKGYGYACNTGIKKATGEYVTIFEPDDYIAKKAYSDVVKKAKKHNLDLVRFGFYLYKNGKKCNSNYLRKIKSLKIPANTVISMLDYPEYISYQPTVWGFIYKKSFLVNNSIYFLETPGASYQDNSFYFKALCLSKTIMILKNQYYYYRQHPQQSVKDKSKLDAPIIELKEIRNFCDTTIKENKNSDDYNTIYFQLINRSIDYFSIHINRLELELKYIFYSKFKKYLNDTVAGHKQYQYYFSKLDQERKDCLVCLLNSKSLNDYLIRKNFYVTDSGVKQLKGKSIIGQLVDIERLTPPFENMFSGYFDIKVMDSKNENHLALKVPFVDRLPQKNDIAEICIIDRNKNIRVIDSTSAWCFQQGNFLQFAPSSDDEIIYNIYDETTQKYCAVVYNLSTSNKRFLPLPIANISSNGKKAISINFSRLFDYRPGYGYCNMKDPHCDEKKPNNDGIFLMDMQTGDYSLIISYNRLWEIFAKGTEVENDKILINHINFNPDNTQLIFLLRFFSKKAPWPTITVTMDISGSNVRKVFGFGSHYHWKNNTELVLTGENIFHKEEKAAITAYNLNTDTLETYPIDKDFFTGDGHCSYSPDRQHILYDSYPTMQMPYRKLMLYDVGSHQGIVLMYLRSDKSLHSFNEDCRCDLHPRWSVDGKEITFDSIHEGFRGVYKIQTSEAITTLNNNYNQLTYKEVEAIINIDEDGYLSKRFLINLLKIITKKIGIFSFLDRIAIELNINTK